MMGRSIGFLLQEIYYRAGTLWELYRAGISIALAIHSLDLSVRLITRLIDC